MPVIIIIMSISLTFLTVLSVVFKDSKNTDPVVKKLFVQHNAVLPSPAPLEARKVTIVPIAKFHFFDTEKNPGESLEKLRN